MRCKRQRKAGFWEGTKNEGLYFDLGNFEICFVCPRSIR
jgi:hypothetical protein